VRQGFLFVVTTVQAAEIDSPRRVLSPEERRTASIREGTMGHIRLGVLPKRPRWKRVIGLLEDREVPASAIADQVLDGARDTLTSDSAQCSLAYCIWILIQLTQAAQSDDFRDSIARIGIRVPADVSATEFLAETSRVATRHLSKLTPRTALNSIAGLALRESLTCTVGRHSSTLFGSGLPEVQHALERYSTGRQFSSLLHVYLTSFLYRVLRFIIDKEMANHLGPGNRFERVRDFEQFDDALEVFASQTSRIVDEFSGGWYSKTKWQEGAISEADARRFVHVALKKLRDDLELSKN
jgi:hypothetical protein